MFDPGRAAVVALAGAMAAWVRRRQAGWLDGSPRWLELGIWRCKLEAVAASSNPVDWCVAELVNLADPIGSYLDPRTRLEDWSEGYERAAQAEAQALLDDVRKVRELYGYRERGGDGGEG